MKKGIYPGSFNPWTVGHEDILKKALKAFDEVTVVVMQNPEKSAGHEIDENAIKALGNVKVIVTEDVRLEDIARKTKANAVIRGIRGGQDLDYERNFQYWCEDIGMEIPFALFLADRNLVHVSSSSVKVARGLGYEC